MTRIRPVVPVRLARELRDAAAIDGVSLRELVGVLLTTFGRECTSDDDEPGPRERLDIPRERAINQLPRQGVPEVFWMTPHGVRTDVMDMSNGSGSFLPVCSQHGLRTGSCLTVGNELSQSSGYAESWICFIDNKPAFSASRQLFNK